MKQKRQRASWIPGLIAAATMLTNINLAVLYHSISSYYYFIILLFCFLPKIKTIFWSFRDFDLESAANVLKNKSTHIADPFLASSITKYLKSVRATPVSGTSLVFSAPGTFPTTVRNQSEVIFKMFYCPSVYKVTVVWCSAVLPEHVRVWFFRSFDHCSASSEQNAPSMVTIAQLK